MVNIMLKDANRDSPIVVLPEDLQRSLLIRTVRGHHDLEPGGIYSMFKGVETVCELVRKHSGPGGSLPLETMVTHRNLEPLLMTMAGEIPPTTS